MTKPTSINTFDAIRLLGTLWDAISASARFARYRTHVVLVNALLFVNATTIMDILDHFSMELTGRKIFSTRYARSDYDCASMCDRARMYVFC